MCLDINEDKEDAKDELVGETCDPAKDVFWVQSVVPNTIMCFWIAERKRTTLNFLSPHMDKRDKNAFVNVPYLKKRTQEVVPTTKSGTISPYS